VGTIIKIQKYNLAKININKLNCLLLLIVFYFLMEYVYKVFVSDYYASVGFSYHFDMTKYLLGKLIVLVPLVSILFFCSSYIFACEVLIVSLFLIPNTILFQFMPFDQRILICVYCFIYSLLLFGIISFRIKSSKFSEKASLRVLILLSILMIIPFIFSSKFHLDFNVLLLKDIYKVRAENIHNYSMIQSYFFPWLAQAILPIGLIFSLNKKKYLVSFFIIVLLVFLFILSAHKSVFFGLLVLVYFLFFDDYYKKSKYFLFTIIGLLLFTRFITVSYNYIDAEADFSRRIFFLPALLNTFYFDFFDNNPVHLSYSIFSGIFHYPYSLDTANLIGEKYFGNPHSHANNGIISSGFMNFGLLGAISNTIGASAIITFINSLNIHPRYFGVTLLILFNFLSSYFFTSLLTHGVLIILLIFTFFLKDTESYA
jgi:hypothetical protein